MDAGVALAGLVVGFAVGLTGRGGGSLMTPLLILVFHLPPTALILSAARRSPTSWVYTCTRRKGRWCCASMRRFRCRPWTGHSRCCR
ncbi:MAG: sulfite exporter TauE/SafE family protein [Candidatus Dormibacteraeota bacterium]|uniref:Probable membrane transporter protein n=1 Tax=Candidatus Amunia macphersoniae TaxID=3127014 RepID=A0A934NK17_9BACT|nr:sulfite exporter TauE/SafE family protein [Candidatus Dormibacteraeota bacterium]